MEDKDIEIVKIVKGRKIWRHVGTRGSYCADLNEIGNAWVCFRTLKAAIEYIEKKFKY